MCVDSIEFPNVLNFQRRSVNRLCASLCTAASGFQYLDKNEVSRFMLGLRYEHECTVHRGDVSVIRHMATQVHSTATMAYSLPEFITFLTPALGSGRAPLTQRGQSCHVRALVPRQARDSLLTTADCAFVGRAASNPLGLARADHV